MSDAHEPACYLLTGATGVLGSAFAEHVLRETNDSLLLLLRPRGDSSPAQRLDELFRFWQLGDLEPAARAQVRVLEGDTEAPQLGLSGEQWQHAAHEVTHLVHAAALVKMTLPLEVAQRAAVSAVENVLALAWQARGHRLKKVELVSTVGVGGRQSQALAETWLEHPRDFHNTYEAAKAEAEVVARRALEAGLPLTVVRPSMVVGDSRSGKVRARQIFSYLCEFLTGTRVHGLFPPLQQARLDTVPVDWVCALLLQSSRTPAWVGRVLHACSADASVSLIELRERVQRIARAHHRPVVHRATLPLVAFRAAARLGKLVGGERGRKAGQLLGILLSYLEDQQRFSNHQTLALAAEVGLTLPDPRSYLDAVLEADFSRL